MIARFFHFFCDEKAEGCAGTMQIPNYGLPDGWKALRAGIKTPLKHLCPNCAQLYDPKDFTGKDGK
jgi:hypothetical protein